MDWQINKNFVLISGPPRAGKDTAAKAIMTARDTGEVALRRFSSPMKNAMSSMIGKPVTTLEPVKDITYYYGKTYRMWQIEMFYWLEQQLGPDVLGVMFIEYIKNNPTGAKTIVVPDSGRQVEAEYVVRTVGAERVCHLHINNPNCTYEGDSREPFTLDHLGVKTIKVTNAMPKEVYELIIVEHFQQWLNNR